MAQKEGSKIASVSDFYNGKCLMITGGTGFVGKVLIEKLLRSCPGIDSIYLLMRPKEEMDVNARLEELIQSKMFDQLRADSPEVFDKLHPVQGDISHPGLGLSESDREKLIHNVNVVFHSAATVSFFEPLKIATQMNLMGTKRIIDLCHKMLQLEVVIHSSTAYSNCDQQLEVKEKFYPSPIEPDNLIQLLEWMDDDTLDYLTPKLLGNRPNTYTYTKAITETVLLNEAEDLPLAIVRPSMVGAAWREPIPGWVDCKHSLTSLIISVGKGFLRTYYTKGDMVVDIIPVDITANLMIVSACYTAEHRNNEIVIYNSVSGTENPIKWDALRAHGLASLITNAVMNDVVCYPGLHFTPSKVLNTIAVFLKHVIPAYVMDMLSRLTGKKPILVKVANRLEKGAEEFEYFTTNEWKFFNDNVQDLHTKLSESDQKIFNLSLAELNWENYIDQYCQGTKQFVLKEEPSTLPQAQKHLDKMWWIQQMLRAACVLMILFVFTSIF